MNPPDILATPADSSLPKNILALVGPTASGKTAVAHTIARARGWAVLSVDALQVYRGLDIGVAKPAPAEREGIRYGGLDLVEPDRRFSAGDYVRAVARDWPRLAAAPAVLAVAGTGLYLRALLAGLDAPPGNPARRAEAEALLERGGVEALQEAVRRAAPAIWAALRDPRNPRRLVRAYERAFSGAPVSSAPRPRPRAVGLRVPTAELAERIRARVRAMYDRGLLEEAAELRRRYPEISATARAAIGYREAWDALDGRCTAAEAMERTIVRTRQYAKRQMTWFRHQMAVEWVEAGGGRNLAEIAEEICDIVERYGGNVANGLNGRA